jgi:hypothetical protein
MHSPKSELNDVRARIVRRADPDIGGPPLVRGDSGCSDPDVRVSASEDAGVITIRVDRIHAGA